MLLSLFLSSALAVEKPTCAVMNFDAKAGLSKDEAELLSERFAGEFGNLGRYRLISRSRMKDVLELQKFARSEHCSATECAIEAGRLLNAQFMVYGSIGKVGGIWTVNAALVSVESGAISSQASVDVEGKVDALLTQGMPDVARKLAPSPEPAFERERTADLGGGVKLELVWIPPGEFTMGSPPTEPDRAADETQRRVTLMEGFWMGKYEVTQEQWEQVMSETRRGESETRRGGLKNAQSVSGGKNNPSSFKGARRPVEQVSWNDCQEFLGKLNVKMSPSGFAGLRRDEGNRNLTFRLPSEAEWEYACRAGTTSRFHTGDGEADLALAGWYAGNSGQGTHEVGRKLPNAWGLYDMHGNVWEWCQNRYSVSAKGYGATDAQGASERVLRGGSWGRTAGNCRSASRRKYIADVRLFINGFRVVAAAQ